MPSSPTPRNRLNLQATGENSGTWGSLLNQQVFSLADEALDGVSSITLGATDVVLTSLDYTTDQARRRVIKLGGTPAATRTITIPSVEKFYVVHNATNIAHIIKAGGLGATVPANALSYVYCDGTDTFAPAAPLAAPVGTVADYAGASAPSGWLFCFGQAISRTTYSALFQAISTAWGAGDGTATFNVPDLRGRATFGKDDMGGTAASRITVGVSGFTGTTLGAVGGDQRMHQHQHTIAQGSHSHNYNRIDFSSIGTGSAGTANVATGQTIDGATTSSSPAFAAGTNTGLTGLGTSQNMPPAAIVNKIIYAGV